MEKERKGEKAPGKAALEENEGEHGEPRRINKGFAVRAQEGKGTFTSATRGEITSS